MRLRYADDEPVSILDNLLPADIAPSMRRLEDNSLYDLFRELDIVPTTAHQVIGARLASVKEAQMLNERRNGRLSMQTDPRLARSAKALADQAEEFHKLAPNIIVKIPATAVGVEAIEEATYRGVSVNVTVSFSVPQAVVTGEAIERGLKRREAEGKDVSTMGPVVTLMVGRLDDWIKEVAKRDKLFLDPGHLEWAGVAAFKRAYAEFQKRGLRARMLSAAFRNVMHWSEFVGGDVVVSPPFAWQQLINNSGYKMVERMDVPVRDDIMETLLGIPEFVRAYEPEGMTPEEFTQFGATRKTLRGFLESDNDLDRLVREVLIPKP